MIYPAITLYQPWATWVMRGWKTIETRTHNRFACLIGQTILIHAGKKTDKSLVAVKNPYLTSEQLADWPDKIINGFILGRARVAGFGELDQSHSKPALIDCETVPRYGLFLEDVKWIDPFIQVDGQLGIWYYDMDKMQKVKKTKHVNNYNTDIPPSDMID